jgi:16S rRNA (guanine527-N7)-methyltransferase
VSLHQEAFGIYRRCLIKWSTAYNLVQRQTLDDFRLRHVVDSAQLFPFVSLWQEKNPHTPIIDVGSGAGFPGAVLAILGIRNLVLVESQKKRCAFLRELRRELQIPFDVQCVRCETLSFSSVGFVVRAVATMKDLVQLARHVSRETFDLWALKGPAVFDEVRECGAVAEVVPGPDRPGTYVVHVHEAVSG